MEEFGNQYGFDAVARDAKQSQETQIKQLQENPLPFTSYEQVDSAKDAWLKFGAQTIAQTIPQVGGSIAGALIAKQKTLPKSIQGTARDVAGA